MMNKTKLIMVALDIFDRDNLSLWVARDGDSEWTKLVLVTSNSWAAPESLVSDIKRM